MKATDQTFERNSFDDVIDTVVAKEENDSEDIQITETETIEKSKTKTPKKVSKTPKKKQVAKESSAANKSDLESSLNLNDHDDEKDEENTNEYRADKDPKIIRFRKYLRLAGLWTGSMVKNSELEAIKSRKTRYDYMKKIFIDAGFTKPLSIENCKKFKAKLEQKKEIAELDMSNIIDTGSRRSRRGASSRGLLVKSESLKESDTEEVEEKDGETTNSDPLANMKDLIGSDSSDEEKKPRRKAKKAMSSDEE